MNGFGLQIEDELRKIISAGDFGNSDAQKVDLEEEFIPVSGVLPRLDIDTIENDFRIIVGRKGAGKTFIIRALNAEFRRKSAICLQNREDLDTSLIYKVDKFLDDRLKKLTYNENDALVDIGYTRDTLWKEIWNKVILASILSVMISSELPNQKRNTYAGRLVPSRGAILEIVSPYIYVPMAPMSPVGYLKAIANKAEDSNEFARIINAPVWSDIRYIVERNINLFPTIAIFIDAVDDEFEKAPSTWMRSQEGLFKAVFRELYNSQKIFSRAKVIVAVREIVLTTILNTEHNMRYIDDNSIMTLSWDSAGIRQFFVKKCASVLSKQPGRIKYSGSDPIVDFIGFDTVYNTRRKSTEPVLDYVVRHTRLLPRDIVAMGNRIRHEQVRRLEAGKQFGEASLRKCVSDVSRAFATETINICMNEFMADLPYLTEVTREWDRAKKDTNGIDERAPWGLVRQRLYDRIHELFDALQFERFDRDRLTKALLDCGLALPADFHGPTGSYYRFDNILWRHGMLAAQVEVGDMSRWRFNWSYYNQEPIIPPSSSVFGLHSCLLDKYNIKVLGREPIC